LPSDTFPLPYMGIVARSSAGSGVVASIARNEVKVIDPDMPIDRIVPLHDVLDESIAEPRFRTLLLGAFALMAVALAGVGIYGLLSFSVVQRPRGVGIRVALGARPGQVVMPVVREGLTLALAGIGVGAIGAFAATRLLKAFLFDVPPSDLLTYVAVALLLLGIALFATYIPSRRAARVDPVTALRAE